MYAENEECTYLSLIFDVHCTFSIAHAHLSGGQDGHGHPVWRAADVVQGDSVEELHGGGVPTVLPAHPALQLGAHRAALRHGHLYQSPHTLLVNNLWAGK